MFCRYKDVFGAPGTGVHAYRIFGMAAVDIACTALAALWVASATRWSAWVVFAALLVLSVPVHRAFCVETTLTRAVLGKYADKNKL